MPQHLGGVSLPVSHLRTWRWVAGNRATQWGGLQAYYQLTAAIGCSPNGCGLYTLPPPLKCRCSARQYKQSS